MIRNVQVSQQNTNFDYSLKNSNGGYLTYWKLTRQLLGQMSDAQNMLPFSFTQKAKMWTAVILKMPWWCLVKPLGWCFSSHTKWTGKYSMVAYNGVINKEEFTNQYKFKTFYFLSIPFFATWGTFNKSDITYLKEKLSK